MPFDKLKQTLQHMGKTPVDEQLQYAEKLKGNDQLKNYMSKMEKDREIVEQLNNERTPFFDNIGNKLKNAADIITEPTEYDELDTSGYLPNQQLAGQGANKMIRAMSAISPEEKDYPVVGVDPEGKPMRFDPTAVMGIVKDPQIIGHIIQNIKNPTKENVLKALAYDIKDTNYDKNIAYRALLEAAARKRIGQDPTISLMSGKYDAKKTMNDILEDLYPEVNRLKNENKISFFDNNPEMLPEGVRGMLKNRKMPNAQTSGLTVPEAIILRNDRLLSTAMHEGQHLLDNLTNLSSTSKRYNTPTNTSELIDKINKFDNSLNLSKKRSIKDPESFLIKNKIDPLDFNQFEHFTDPDYIKNYERDKAIEILQGNPKKLDTDAVVNNYDIIKSILDEARNAPISLEDANRIAEKRGFQKLDKVVRKK